MTTTEYLLHSFVPWGRGRLGLIEGERVSEPLETEMERLVEGSGHLAAQIRELAGAARHPVEIHLPVWGAWCPEMRKEELAAAHIRATPDGRLLACRGEEEETPYQAALALSSRSGTLAFHDRRLVPAGHAPYLLGGVLLDYGFPAEALSWLALQSARNPAAKLEFALTLRLPARRGRAWLSAPALRCDRFFPAYAAVSRRIQACLRQWLPLVFFSDLSHYETGGMAYPMLVYGVTPPFSPEPKDNFTWDFTRPGTGPLFHYYMEANLARQLRALHEHLRRVHPQAARLYRPQLRQAILRRLHYLERKFHRLVSLDTRFVNALVKLGTQLAGLPKDLPAPRQIFHLVQAAELYAAESSMALRNLYGLEPFEHLGGLLWLEATDTLGGGGGIEATLEVRGPESNLVSCARLELPNVPSAA